MCREETAKKIPLPKPGLGSCCQLGLSKVGVLRESRHSLLPQTVKTSLFNCLKSCRELNIEAFLREERVLWGHIVWFGFYLPPWNVVKTWGSQHAKSRLCRTETPHAKVKGKELSLGSGFIIISVYSRKEISPFLNSVHVVFSSLLPFLHKHYRA